jgi:hypothetical protein
MYTVKNNINNILEEWRGYFLAVGSGSAPIPYLFPRRRWGDYIKVLEFCNKLNI